jgi:hypothetical protein
MWGGGFEHGRQTADGGRPVTNDKKIAETYAGAALSTTRDKMSTYPQTPPGKEAMDGSI